MQRVTNVKRSMSFQVLAIALVGSTCCELANAQTSSKKALQPVDAGIADRSPLAVSQRVVPTDLRAPSAFDRVYRLDGGMQPDGQQRTYYARKQGALTAVFPQSQYLDTAIGSIPEIPAGTVFYIGGSPGHDYSVAGLPSAVRKQERSPARNPGYQDLSVRQGASTAAPLTSAAPEPLAPQPRPVTETGGAAAEISRNNPSLPASISSRAERRRPSVFTSEEFRQRRIAELIASAVAQVEAHAEADDDTTSTGSVASPKSAPPTAK